MEILVVCSNAECGEIFGTPEHPPEGKATCPACGKVTLLESAAPPVAAGPVVTGPAAAADALPARPRYHPPHPSLQLQSPPLEAAPEPPPQDTPQESSFHATGVLESLTNGQAPEPGTNVLGFKTSRIAMAVFGMLGLSAGAVGGAVAEGNHVLGLYAGAFLGWVAGFAAGALMVLTVERNEPAGLRCPICRNLFPAGTESCTLCGSALTAESADLFAADCLAAGQYALSCRGSIAGMAALAAISFAAIMGLNLLVQAYPAAMELWQYLLWSALAAWLLLAAGYWADSLAGAARGALMRKAAVPHRTRLLAPANLGPLLRLALAAAVYVAPIVLLPLAPLALVGVGIPGALHPLRLGTLVRTAMRLTKDLAVLWMVMLLYLGAMAAGVALVVAIQWGASSLPPLEGWQGVAVAFAVNLAMVTILAIDVSVFGLAIFRCAGLFARHNRHSLSIDLRAVAVEASPGD